MAIGDQRLTALRVEFVRTTKSLAGVTSLLVGGLIPFAFLVSDRFPAMPPLFLGAIVLLAMLLPFTVVLAWNLSRYAEDRFWFDRKYLVISAKWSYTPNRDLQTLRAVCNGRRHVKCLAGELDYITVSVSPSENLVPFSPDDDYELALEPKSDYEGGEIVLREPHRKSADSFSFRAHFYPPLKEGQSADVRFRFVLPRFKISNRDYLRHKSQTAKLEARDYEFGSWLIEFPTDRFVWETRFSAECRIQPRALEALRGTTVYAQERSELEKWKAVRSERLDGGWLLRLDREKPPVRTRYRISWVPPTLAELRGAMQEALVEHSQ